jgi:hypothetical protein
VDAESVTGATRLYERVGMTPYPRFATWEKELRPAAIPAKGQSMLGPTPKVDGAS